MRVKFALPKLKVQADWFSPVHRNSAEYAWMQVVSKVAPTSAVKLFGQSRHLNGFAMEFIEGDDTYLWKTTLLAGSPGRGEASMVGELVGRVHAASTNPEFDTKPFQCALHNCGEIMLHRYHLRPVPCGCPDLAPETSMIVQKRNACAVLGEIVENPMA